MKCYPICFTSDSIEPNKGHSFIEESLCNGIIAWSFPIRMSVLLIPSYNKVLAVGDVSETLSSTVAYIGNTALFFYVFFSISKLAFATLYLHIHTLHLHTLLHFHSCLSIGPILQLSVVSSTKAYLTLLHLIVLKYLDSG